MSVLEKCSNCDRAIGRLETPQVWKESVVCAECHARLEAQAPKPMPEPLPKPTINDLYTSEGPKPSTVATYFGYRGDDPSPPAGPLSRRDITEGVALGVGKVIGIILVIIFILWMLSLAYLKATT
jgi:hypothetical protein